VRTVLLEPQQQATWVVAFRVSMVKFRSKMVQGARPARQEKNKGRAEPSACCATWEKQPV
jgi:hypothetical protein